MQNLHFPSINLNNLKKFEKKYLNAYLTKNLTKFQYLAYDALGINILLLVK